MIIRADARSIPLADRSVHCVVTSPPYWGLRDYGVAGQLGLEKTPEEYISRMVEVFREVKRVLRDDGTLWLNMGDSYAGSGNGWQKGESSIPRGWLTDNLRGRPEHYISSKQPNGLKPKDLVGIPWMLAFALRADGWYLRSDIIWAKPNPMPESVTDRPTKAHEYIFLLSKSERYYYDSSAIKEDSVYGPGEGGHQRFGAPGGKAEIAYKERVSGEIWDSDGKRNKRSVWEVATTPFPDAHFATFPEELIKPCILAGCPAGGASSRSLCGQWHHHSCSEKSPVQRRGPRAQRGVHRDCETQAGAERHGVCLMPTFIVKLDGAEVARFTGEGLEFAQRNGADDPKMVRLQHRGHSVLVVVCSTQENVTIERCADAQ